MNDYFDLEAFMKEHRSLHDVDPDTSSLRFEDFLPRLTQLKAEYQHGATWMIHPRTMYQIGVMTRKHSFVFADGTTKLKPLSRKARLRMNRRRTRKVG